MKNRGKILGMAFAIALSTAEAKDYEIKMHNLLEKETMVFQPDFLRASVGDRIVFLAKDDGHEVKQVFGPKEDSENKPIENGKFIDLENEGIYVFECTNHALLTMMAVVQVGDAKNQPIRAQNFLRDYKKSVVSNGHRIDQILKKLE